MGKGGRPKIYFDWDQFNELVSFQCTQLEVASFFKCSVDTLDARCREDLGMSLAEVYDKRKLFGKIRLRKAQFKIAESNSGGAAAMAIFLGKQLLGQRDQPEPEIPESTGKVQKRTFEEFCEQAGYFIPYPKQVEMMEFVIHETRPRMLMGSRGYGKTDIAEIMGAAYDIYCLWLDGEYTSYLIITKSKARSSAIVREMGNALIANGIPLETQNSLSIRVVGQKGKDETIEAVSLKTSLRSRHPKKIIMDDPVTEEDTSEATRKLVKKKYDEAYKLCENICIIGQPAHKFDLYAELRDKLLLMECPWGTIPELDQNLDLMLKAGIDPDSIEMSYHLRIPKSGSSIFSNIKFIDKFPTGPSVAFIDPSDGGDYTALSMIRGYMNGVAVEGRAYKKAWFHCLDELVGDLVKGQVQRVAFETNSTGTQALDILRKVLAPHGIGVVGVNTTTNKEADIMNAGSFAHMIHLSKESHKVYTDMVVQYEYSSKFDDAPDSLARCLIWMGLIRGKK